VFNEYEEESMTEVFISLITSVDFGLRVSNKKVNFFAMELLLAVLRDYLNYYENADFDMDGTEKLVNSIIDSLIFIIGDPDAV
jgi:hypothetical protein